MCAFRSAYELSSVEMKDNAAYDATKFTTVTQVENNTYGLSSNQ